jgi:hypothetical protein
MANVTIFINDVNLADVRDTLCTRWGYSGDGTSASKVAFLKARIARWIKDEYKLSKADAAVVTSVDTVRETAIATAETVDIQ